MQVNKHKQQSRANIEASFAPNSLELPSGSVPKNTDGVLYNFDGSLYWGKSNFSAAIIEGSKWSLSSNGVDVYRDNGKIGINTASPTVELEVNGKIKTKELQIGNQSGFVKAINGNLKTAPILLSDIENIEIKSFGKLKQVLVFDGKVWTNVDISSLSHSELNDLDVDSHKKYLNEERHNALKHNISTLNVNDILVINDKSISINAPLIIGSTITFNDKIIIEKLELPKLNGILVARNGHVETGVTTTDIPEGTNLYYKDEKVLNLTQGNYLALDGSNITRFSGFQQFVEGLDADKLDGKDASDFALIQHKHYHKDLDGISPDDHHKQKHVMNGKDHIISGKVGQFLKITDTETSDFVNIAVDDLPVIPFDKVGNGEINGFDIVKLKNIKGNIQEQLNSKSDSEHIHSHKELEGLSEDQHLQYLNDERALLWISSLNTDYLKEGKNLYYSDEKVKDFSNEQYMRLDGTNSVLADLSKSIININADLLDGLHAIDFSKNSHVHNHKELIDITQDDHHDQKHNIIGNDHLIGDAKELTFLRISDTGKLTFDKLSAFDMPFNIPLANISDGKITNSEFSYLSGIKSNLQEQLEAKAGRNHIHSHKDLTGLDKDDHISYYNNQRLEDWLASKTLDNISNGISNKHISIEVIKEFVKLEQFLYWNKDSINLKYDTNVLSNVNGVLTTIQDISKKANVSFSSITIGNVNINSNGIGINNPSPKFALDVDGDVYFEKVHMNGSNGILSLRDGLVVSGANLEDLSNVNFSQLQNGILIYRGNGWDIVGPEDVISIPPVVESFDYSIHMEDSHNIRKINVNNGVFVVEKENIKLGNEVKPILTEITGKISLDGILDIDGSLSFGVKEPRAGLDLGVNSVVAGPKNMFNTFDLFSPADNSATLSLYNGVKFRFNSIETQNSSVASFEVVHNGIVKFDALTNQELIFSVGADASISFASGGLKVLTIASNDYIGLGTSTPAIPVDSRGFLGVANVGNKPTNWLMFRADIASNDPVISFPQNKKLLIGSYDNYAPNGIWQEILSINKEKFEIKSSEIYINGQIKQSIARKKIVEIENNDVDISGSNFIKFISASDNFNITGFENGSDGKQITLMNGTGFDLEIKPENAGSSANNRIYGKNSIIVKSKEIVKIIYDNDEQRWIVI